MFKSVIVVFTLFAVALAAHISLPTPRFDGRIVGGKDADIGDFPYQLSLLSYGSHICGASIISANWVLTAAHCVERSSASSVSFRAGSSLRGSGGTVHQATTIIVHPKYDSDITDFDYALVKVDVPFPLGKVGVAAVELADAEPKADEVTAVTGWGTTSAGGSSPKQLQVVNVPIVNRAECEEKYNKYTITERMICAGSTIGGKDSCQGDSGGPMVINGKQVGIVSWGVGCADAKYPGVYTNVAYERSWINEQTGV